jgi:2,3-diketo-5-methylthiopentyl-1-phosphate enolase
LVRVKYLLENKNVLPRINQLAAKMKYVIDEPEKCPDNDEKHGKYCLNMQFEDQPSFPALLTKVFGAFSYIEGVSLLDIDFDEKGLAQFKGPKFGIEGVRKILDVYDRPLLLTVNKPQHGISPETSAHLFMETALGGVDILKDDELLGDSSYSTAKERMSKMAEVIKKVYAQTGKKKMYCPNITGTIQQMVDKAKLAAELGTNGVMVNAFSSQMEVMRVLAENPEVQVPILIHSAHCGVLTSVISPPVLFGKFLRYLGADMVIFPTVTANKPFGTFGVSREDYEQIINLLRLPMKQCKTSFPAPGGGVQADNVSAYVEKPGKDFIILAGRGVHYHPEGPREGARFLLDAINKAMASITKIN